MNYTLVENNWDYNIQLTHAAKSFKDLYGKTIEHIVTGGEVAIRFTDGSCAIFETEYGQFRDEFSSTDLHFYGFLLGQIEVEKIKELVKEKLSRNSVKYKKNELIRLKSKVEELERELSNS